MNSLRLSLQDDRKKFSPGEKLCGVAEWTLSTETQGDVHVHLLWHTEGKGSKDAEVIESISKSVSGLQGSMEFEWQLPQSPYSYQGTLLSIVWEVELLFDGIDEVERLAFELRPSDAVFAGVMADS